MVNFCAVCGCCTRTDIVREHLEDALRICDVIAMGLLPFILNNESEAPLPRKYSGRNYQAGVFITIPYNQAQENSLRRDYSITAFF
jgi:hypothetical protein